MPDVLFQTLLDWKENGWHKHSMNKWDLMFPSRRGAPLNENDLREAIKAAAIETAKEYYEWDIKFPNEELDPKTLMARVNEEDIKKEHFRVDLAGCHLMRHGFARFCLEHAGIPLVELQRICGHSNFSQTLAYAEFQREDGAEETRAAVLMDVAIGQLSGETPGETRRRVSAATSR